MIGYPVGMSETKYTLSFAFSDDVQEFTSAAKAGEAFFHAKAEDRPRVIKSDGRSASTIARTVIVGDEIGKSLPLEIDQDFTDGFKRLQLDPTP